MYIHIYLYTCVFICMCIYTLSTIFFFFTSETQALAHLVLHTIKTLTPALIHISFIPLYKVERHAICQ